MIWCYWEERLNVGGSWYCEIWFDVFEKDINNKAERAEAPPASNHFFVYILMKSMNPIMNTTTAAPIRKHSTFVRYSITCIVFDSK